MDAQRSPLQWHSYTLLQCHFEIAEPTEDAPVVPLELFAELPIAVDFVHKKLDDGNWQVFTKVEVNWKKPALTGYRIYVECVGLFHLEGEQDMAPEKRKNLLFYSTVNMLLNRMRGQIADLSGSSALGPFILPALDISALFRQKAEQIKVVKAAKEPKPKA